MNHRQKIYATLLLAALAGTAYAQQPPAPGDKTLLAAEGLYARGQYQSAAEEYQQFIQEHPQDPRLPNANFGLALCKYQSGDMAAAADLLANVLKDPAFPRREDALALVGQIELSRNHLDAALAALNDLLKNYPTSKLGESAEVNRAQVLYRMGRPNDAATAAADFLKRNPKSGQAAGAMYLLALCEHAEGQEAAALDAARAVTDRYPNSPYELDANLLVGQCLQGQGKFAEAADQYKNLARGGTALQQAAALYGLGTAQRSAGKYQDALATFQGVVTRYTQSPYAPEARLQSGITQLQAGDTAAARKTFSDVSLSDPSRVVSANYWLARCDMAESHFKEARAALDALAKTTPPPAEIADVLFDRARSDLALGNNAAAAGEFQQFAAAYPQSPHLADALYQQSLALFRQKSYDDSLAVLQKVQQLKVPELQRPLLRLGAEDLFMTAHYADAGKLFEALAKNPTDPKEAAELAFRRGQCAYLAGDYATAIALLKPAGGGATRSPDENPDALFLLGDAYLQTNQNPEAADAFKRFLAASKDRTDEARYKLAIAQVRTNAPADAEATLKDILATDADSVWKDRGRVAYGQLLYNAKKPTEAGATLNAVLAKNPDEELAAPALFTLGQIELETQHPADAAKHFQTLADTYPKNDLAGDARYQQAVALKAAADNAAALNAAEAYVKANPEGKHAADARELSAVALTKLGKGEEATERLSALAAHKNTRTDTVLYDLAWAQRSAKKEDAAVATYKSLLAEFPDSKRSTAARVELPELLYAQGHYADAAAMLEDVLANPNADAHALALARYRLGFCYARLTPPQLEKAAAAFDHFIAENPHDDLATSARYEVGVVYAALNKLPEARERLSAAAADDAHDAVAKLAALKLGEVQNQAAEYEAAEKTFTDFLARHPTDDLAYLAQFGMGWACENLEKYDDARTWYGKVTAGQNGPTAARAQFQTGETYFAQKKFDQAAKELLKVDILYAYPQWSSSALYEAGRAFEQLNQPDQAVTQYKTCVEKYPTTEPAALARARLTALGKT